MFKDKKSHDRVRRWRAERDVGEMESRIVKKLHLDCCGDTKHETGIMAGMVSDMLEDKGYRYGYNGKPCERRASSNMPYIVVDVTNGFYWGSKGADTAVNWTKMTQYIFEKLYEKLPDIDAIQTKARKNDGAIDRHMRQPSKDGRKMERFWITGTGRPMPISAMKDDHLHNTILMVDRTIAEGSRSIGGNEDLANLLDELEDERIHRGLHLPLIPLISLEYRKGTHHDKY